jgi:hypothetical protein
MALLKVHVRRLARALPPWVWMWFRRTRRETSRRVKDTCLLCSKPVYEDDPGLDFLGLWMHRECFDREEGFVPNADDRARAA